MSINDDVFDALVANFGADTAAETRRILESQDISLLQAIALAESHLAGLDEMQPVSTQILRCDEPPAADPSS